MRLSQALPFPEPGYRTKRWRHVVAAFKVVVVLTGVLVPLIGTGYRKEKRTYYCGYCLADKTVTDVDFWLLPLSHTIATTYDARVTTKANPAHVHKWRALSIETTHGIGIFARRSIMCFN